jgi:hypothetical protein
VRCECPAVVLGKTKGHGPKKQGCGTTFGRRKENVITLDQALRIVKDRYGLLDSYVAGTGMMMHVVRAERKLRGIPGVKLPESGIALLAREVIDLACGAVTTEGLVRKKNPELFGG